METAAINSVGFPGQPALASSMLSQHSHTFPKSVLTSSHFTRFLGHRDQYGIVTALKNSKSNGREKHECLGVEVPISESEEGLS
jgi:hypothetical protein